MKILVTGMTSTHVNETARSGAYNMSGIIAKVLRDEGMEVTVKALDLTDSEFETEIQSYDRIYVGMGPLKGLGTAYMYPALAINALVARGKIVPFIDDTDTRKIQREFETCLDRPDELFKPFWRYKRNWNLVNDDDDLQKQILHGVVEFKKAFFTYVLVPAWNADTAFRTMLRMNRQWADISLPVDASGIVIPEGTLTPSPDMDKRPVWGTGWKEDSTAVLRSGTHAWEVERLNRRHWNGLATVSGVLVPGPGWCPEVAAAVPMGIPVSGHWKTLAKELGPSYEVLPGVVEMMSQSERNDLAARQADEFIKACTETDRLRDTIVLTAP